MKPSVSFVVVFYNENKNICNTFKTIKKVIAKNRLYNYEIIFVNDGSTDNSKLIVKNLLKHNKNCILINNKINSGYGFSIKRGFLAANNKFILLVPGDNEHDEKGISPLFQDFGKFKMVIPFIINNNARRYSRRILSTLYTIFLNVIFFKSLKYYNGLVLYNRMLVNSVQKDITNFSFSYVAELLIRCLRICDSYKFVGYKIKIQKIRNSNAIKIKNFYFTIYFILKLRILLLFK
jgi:glycosyltransferase involved in cell wall biosynthesis